MAVSKKGSEFDRLLLDEKKYLRRLLPLAEDLLGIDQSTGKTVVLAPIAKLYDRERLFLQLLGRYFASELGLKEEPSADIAELSADTGLGGKAVSARMSELRQIKVIEVLSAGRYKVLLPNAESFVREIRSRVEYRKGWEGREGRG